MVRMTLKVWQVSVTVVLDYLLMLIAMTFNVGLFASLRVPVSVCLVVCVPECLCIVVRVYVFLCV